MRMRHFAAFCTTFGLVFIYIIMLPTGYLHCLWEGLEVYIKNISLRAISDVVVCRILTWSCRWFFYQELDEMAFQGDEKELSSKRDELTSLDSRNTTIANRQHSKKLQCYF